MDTAEQRQWFAEELARLTNMARDISDHPEGATYSEVMGQLGLDAGVFVEAVTKAVLGAGESNGVPAQLLLVLLDMQPWLSQTITDVAFFFFAFGHGWNAARAEQMRAQFGEQTLSTDRTAVEVAGYMRRAVREIESGEGVLSDQWVTRRLNRWASALEADDAGPARTA